MRAEEGADIVQTYGEKWVFFHHRKVFLVNI